VLGATRTLPACLCRALVINLQAAG